MSYLDLKYANLLSADLQQFKHRGNNVFNFRCPYCGDSQKSKTKSRGYLFEHNGKLTYKCHNCGVSKPFHVFLKEINPILYKEYLLEKFGGNDEPKKVKVKKSLNMMELLSSDSILKKMTPLVALPESHEAVKYVSNRLIPKHQWKRIWFVDDINTITRLLPRYKEKKLDNTPKIVLPYINQNSELTHIQFRSIRNTGMRYITLQVVSGDSIPKIFGLDSCNTNKQYYVTEGPIDSLFLSNAIAMGGSDVSISDLPNTKNAVIVYDNEPRNKQIMKKLDKAIKSGCRVVIYDKVVDGLKDINDMVLHKFKDSHSIESYLQSRIFGGLRAQLEFAKYKK